jgi:RHS repeat-associated protein
LGGSVIGQVGRTLADARFFIADGHGSTRLLTDLLGAVAARYDYDAFGVPRFDAGAAATRLLYNGQWADGGAGLYYLRARFYDPRTGRFTQLDPFPGLSDEPLSLHKYQYAFADPVNLSDPSGMIPGFLLDPGPSLFSFFFTPFIAGLRTGLEALFFSPQTGYFGTLLAQAAGRYTAFGLAVGGPTGAVIGAAVGVLLAFNPLIQIFTSLLPLRFALEPLAGGLGYISPGNGNTIRNLKPVVDRAIVANVGFFTAGLLSAHVGLALAPLGGIGAVVGGVLGTLSYLGGVANTTALNVQVIDALTDAMRFNTRLAYGKSQVPISSAMFGTFDSFAFPDVFLNKIFYKAMLPGLLHPQDAVNHATAFTRAVRQYLQRPVYSAQLPQYYYRTKLSRLLLDEYYKTFNSDLSLNYYRYQFPPG